MMDNKDSLMLLFNILALTNVPIAPDAVKAMTLRKTYFDGA
jgi:hypothetical protein